jgi:hypothetical protein
MGMFKDMFSLTKQANELKKSSGAPGMRDMLKQAPGQLKQATEQLQQIQQTQAGAPSILENGDPGKGIVRAMGTPARAAQWFNLDIDLEVHVGGRKPYRVMNEYMVPHSAQLSVGAELPIKVDRSDPAKIAIDWDGRGEAPAKGEIRPA